MNAVSRYLRPVASVASIALFVYLLHRTGPMAVLENIRVVGWGAVALILLSGARHVLRALGWSYCVQTNGRRPVALDLLGPRLIGEALSDLTPAGPLLGEPAKVVAVSHLIPVEAGASSVVIENLIYALAAVLFMLSGLVFALVEVAALRGLWWIGGGLVIGSLACIALVGWTLTRRILLLGRMLDFLKRLGLHWAFLERHEQSVRDVEHTIYEFFLKSRRTFLAVLAIEIATNFTGVGEAYLILNVTTAHTSLFAAYLVESASRAAQLAFSFVPLGLGVQEGAAAATLQAVGYAASEGVSLAVIRKIRTLFWAAIGLFFWTKYSILSPVAERSAASYEAAHCQR
ncbi:MAG TPA: lysylphosphatidylglycerol synthase domain-containing protein [Bryobacteraceae bacterium]|nr:lysylphosphatidylglycerol synthase domain-containing protein [Bryobacteraceae bacterium]HZW94747.1 lysylphosphatidylglycerol synthase domain-containing protein [Candidatus Eremiobacteraceae bacterium]